MQVGADGFPKMVANVHPTGAQRNATALFTVHNIVDQADIPCTWMPEVRTHARGVVSSIGSGISARQTV